MCHMAGDADLVWSYRVLLSVLHHHRAREETCGVYTNLP